MKLFRKKIRAIEAAPDSKVFYSTPFGDTKDGHKKVFIVDRGGVQYFRLFTDEGVEVVGASLPG
ncbi:hypothetical protein [Mycobacteroides abscessus]|uniref:hypothetical protein n=1 Tax=Mycobacteroides abscessus TaxID=36809 RepID=UPI000696F98C|nr:hypothetical protein [Mycobacteroides abscessus]